MTNIRFRQAHTLEVGDVIYTGAGTRQTITEIDRDGLLTYGRQLKISFEDRGGYGSHGFYYSNEEFMTESKGV